MRLATKLSLVLLASTLPLAASANCYSIYSPRNVLVYQSTLNPVDLSRTLTEALRARFPGHHLVMDPDASSCSEVGAGSQAGRSERNASGRSRGTEQILESSPVTRDGRSPMDPSTMIDETEYLSTTPTSGTAPRRTRRGAPGALNAPPIQDSVPSRTR
jgi:hypothetical protein